MEHSNGAATVGEAQRRPGRFVLAVPIVDKVFDGLRLQGRSHHPTVCAVGPDSLGDVAAGEVERRVPHPLLALAIYGFEFGVADAISYGAEGGTCLDRL